MNRFAGCPVKIRRAELEDAPAITDVFLAACEEMTYLPVLHTAEETEAWIRDTVLASREVWVAAGDLRSVGFAALAGEFLEHLYIHPAAQRAGLGTCLLQLAKERCPGGLQLWVFQRNEGDRRFYERHGFVLRHLTDGAANEEREPDALYE
jgi:GNAT superfamily N-acetyltransferase